ncbi:MAG: type II CAAX endopeptidase family protein [Alkalibacterium sp.]|nr:type II CAAX endopeptidase family protein [Alkalibacterium sp.]
MNHSLHKVSLLKIAAFSAFAFVLSVLSVIFITPFFPEGSKDFLEISGRTGIILAVAFFIVRHFGKAGISFHSIIGDKSVNNKLLLFSSAHVNWQTYLYFSFVGLILRLFITRPEFPAFALSLMEDTAPVEFNNWLIISTVILGPVIEEFIFRGIILNKWAEKSTNTRALIISSLLFGILHIGSFIVPQFIGGLLYGIVYIKTKKLIYPIIMHGINNLIPVSLYFLPSVELTEAFSVSELISELTPVLNISALIFILMLPIFIVVVYRYSRNLNDEVSPFAFNSRKSA